MKWAQQRGCLETRETEEGWGGEMVVRRNTTCPWSAISWPLISAVPLGGGSWSAPSAWSGSGLSCLGVGSGPERLGTAKHRVVYDRFGGT
jgi:hypothetical protein